MSHAHAYRNGDAGKRQRGSMAELTGKGADQQRVGPFPDRPAIASFSPGTQQVLRLQRNHGGGVWQTPGRCLQEID
jgi:hypothetical protein